jgi:cbb3-type cytochrome oxidase cytochrome c subunit
MFASTDDYLYNYQERRDSQQIFGYGDDPPSSGTRDQYSNSSSFASMEEYSEMVSQIIDPVLRRMKEKNSAYLNLADNYSPASYIPHQNMPYFPNVKDEETRDSFYKIEEE